MATHSNYEETTSPIRQKIDDVVEEGQQLTKELATQVQEQTKDEVAKRKSQTASQLDNVAQAFRQTGQQLRHKDQQTLASYTEKMAEQVERMTSYLDEKNVDQIIADAERFARRQPELFIGSAFTLGLLAARFIKSSGQRRQAEYFERDEAASKLGRYDQYDTQDYTHDPYRPPASFSSSRGRYDPS